MAEVTIVVLTITFKVTLVTGELVRVMCILFMLRLKVILKVSKFIKFEATY